MNWFRGEYKVHYFQDTACEYRWHVEAGNHQIVATSGEGYTRKHDCHRAFRRFARAMFFSISSRANAAAR